MADTSEALSRFRASMVMDFDKWHDGIPYDLRALAEVSEVDRNGIASELAAKPELDWRDVEALRAIGTPEALKRIGEAAGTQGDHGGAAALRSLAEGDWTPALEDRFLAVLETARLMETSFDRLFAIAERHPTPRVIEALLRLATKGHEGTRYAFGAFLLYLYAQADEWYGLDDRFRPHLLDLSGTPPERAAAEVWLKARLTGPVRKSGAES